MKMDFVAFGARNLALDKENTRALSILARLRLHLKEATDEGAKWRSMAVEWKSQVCYRMNDLYT